MADKTASPAARFLGNNIILLVLIAMIAAMSILKPNHFPTMANFGNILRQMSIIGIIALGTSLTIIAKGIDVSSGAMVALSAVVGGSLAGMNSSTPMVVAIFAGLAIGCACGLVNGLVTAYGKVPPFIATLAMSLIARGFAQIYTNGKPQGNFSKSFLFIGGGSVWGVPMPIIIFVFMILITYVLLHKTKLGSYIYAIGSNEIAAVTSGINTRVIILVIYAYAGLTAAMAGILLASRSSAALPSYGVSYEMDAITCAVIGGVSFLGGIGTIKGVVIGICIVGILSNAMTMLLIDTNWQTVIKGAVIVTAVLLDQRRDASR